MRVFWGNSRELLVDAACFSAAGSYLGHHFVKMMRIPFSLTPGQFITGGLLNAATIGVGNSLFKRDDTPVYQRILIVVAALSVSTFSAPYITQAIAFKTGIILTVESAAAIAAFNFACKIASLALLYFPMKAKQSINRIQLKIPTTIQEAENITLDQVEGIHSRIFHMATSREINEIPLAIRVILNKYFAEKNLRLIFYDGFGLKDHEKELSLLRNLNQEQVVHLYGQIRDAVFIREDQSVLNRFFYEKKMKPQTNAQFVHPSKELLDDLKNLNLDKIASSSESEIAWFYLFRMHCQTEEIMQAIVTRYAEIIKKPGGKYEN